MRLTWKKHYHRSGALAHLDASIVKTGFPGFVDIHTATVFPFEDGSAMAYVALNDNQASRTCIWADKRFTSIRAAQGWARSVLERL